MWMTASIPAFGFKKNPYFHNAFFIGDAQNTIPPASGAGLSLSIISGKMAAEYALRDDAPGFITDWRKGHSKQIKMAKWMHFCMLRPTLFKTYASLLPALSPYLFKHTRSL